MGLFGFLKRDKGDRKDSGSSRGSSGSTAGVSNRSLKRAIQAAQRDPDKILEARVMIEEMEGQLSNSERAAAYKALASAPRYRNQRDNVPGKHRSNEEQQKYADSTCNFTSMAMAFEGLGMDLNDSSTKQGEENLADAFYGSGRGSRTSQTQRRSFARSKGVGAQLMNCPNFSSGASAKKWFTDNILPHLQRGAQATMGLYYNGKFAHIVRLEWVEDKGLKVDDPFAKSDKGKDGEMTWSSYNTNTRKSGTGEQAGVGSDNVVPWEAIAEGVRYVHLYTASAGNMGAFNKKGGM